MPKKAYRMRKVGDFYVLPAGYVHGKYYEEIRVMDKERAKEIMRARKTISLKKKYPEVREGVRKLKPETVQKCRECQGKGVPHVKMIPDMIIDRGVGMHLKGINNYQVTYANAQHYINDGYVISTVKTDNEQYALYVSDQKWRHKDR